MIYRIILLWVLFLSVSSAAFAQISHKVSFEGRANHYFEVESTFSVPSGDDEIEIVMATWTPGSYLVRDYSRHVENITSSNANIEKTAKNIWKLSDIDGRTVTVKYRVYGREMTVRTNWVDNSFAFINGASTFMRPLGRDDETHKIEMILPSDWSASAASITKAKFRKNIYIADDWDEIMDSPMVAGNIQILEVPAKTPKYPHYLVQVGDTDAWDNEKALQAVADIVDVQQEFWGTDPFEKPYYFLNVIADARGGLEHKHNTALMHRRFAMQSRDDWVNWMGLVGHEYFHSWNVKRLRPKALGPFDYEKENYVSELWFAEGLTSYYANLLNYRAGLIDEKELLSDIASDAKYLGGTAGQEVRSVAESSYDAWIRGYRPDENSTNAHVSYYAKGAMIGLGLDAKIREASDNASSLDDLMRAAYDGFSGEAGFENSDVYALAEEIGGETTATWLQARVETQEYLDTDFAYDYLGLNLKDENVANEPDEFAPAYLGLNFDSSKSDLIVSRVAKGTPAFEAGVNAKDELIAINNNRVTKSGYSGHMKLLRPDQDVELLLVRRGKMLTVPAKTESKPLDKWVLSLSEDLTETQSSNYGLWSSAPESE